MNVTLHLYSTFERARHALTSAKFEPGSRVSVWDRSVTLPTGDLHLYRHLDRSVNVNQLRGFRPLTVEIASDVDRKLAEELVLRLLPDVVLWGCDKRAA